MSNKTIRIGTRDSQLALWQAKTVQNALLKLGHQAELVPVKSKGDLVLDKPLYEFGITGIFTRTLDLALLQGEIDIAVHSMKDVPTALPNGIVDAAVLKRANSQDVLVHKGLEFLNASGTIATGSLRRKAQWLAKYPTHTVENLRGNINTRLKKLNDNPWNGAVFASAGLERLNLNPDNCMVLDWMLPAPAQGAMLVVAKEDDDFCRTALRALNHKATETCVHIEREFLKTLEGGCTAPIGALATIKDQKIYFKGGLYSLDGKQKIEDSKTFPTNNHEKAGKEAANSILLRGGKALMKEINKNLES